MAREESLPIGPSPQNDDGLDDDALQDIIPHADDPIETEVPDEEAFDTGEGHGHDIRNDAGPSSVPANGEFESLVRRGSGHGFSEQFLRGQSEEQLRALINDSERRRVDQIRAGLGQPPPQMGPPQGQPPPAGQQPPPGSPPPGQRPPQMTPMRIEQVPQQYLDHAKLEYQIDPELGLTEEMTNSLQGFAGNVSRQVAETRYLLDVLAGQFQRREREAARAAEMAEAAADQQFVRWYTDQVKGWGEDWYTLFGEDPSQAGQGTPFFNNLFEMELVFREIQARDPNTPAEELLTYIRDAMFPDVANSIRAGEFSQKASKTPQLRTGRPTAAKRKPAKVNTEKDAKAELAATAAREGWDKPRRRRSSSRR